MSNATPRSLALALLLGTAPLLVACADDPQEPATDAADTTTSDVDAAVDADAADTSEDPASDVDATPDTGDTDADTSETDTPPADTDTDRDTADAGDIDATDRDTTPDVDPEDADASPDTGPDTGGRWVELGTGLDSFTALGPNDPVVLTEGIQGGYHVWVALRGGGFDAARWPVRARMVDTDGTTLILGGGADEAFVDVGDALEHYALIAFLSNEFNSTAGLELLDGEVRTLCAYVDFDDISLEVCEAVTIQCCDYL